MKTMLELYMNDSDETQVGIDEAGRGCFAGPVVAAAVIWDTSWLLDNLDVYNTQLGLIKDSKKMTKKKRKECEHFIKSNAKAYSISFIDENVIDDINILNATHKAMHNCVDTIESNFEIDRILIDGSNFKPYMSMNNNGFVIPHYCITNGDNKYLSIASASILAKVSRDEYMEELCEKYPQYQEKYDWVNNKGYGTKKHLLGINNWGICEHHRKTFGICKNYCTK